MPNINLKFLHLLSEKVDFCYVPPPHKNHFKVGDF